ncbi:MAG: hypothetical protein WAW92_02775 [Minisyncoccia bacterium]
MNTKDKKIKNGFALLIAIVTTSLLLLVSFVVVNTALKQVVIAYSNQESQYAYYNAESGIECAIYWDLKNPSGTSAFATNTPSTISCNSANYSVGGGGVSNATSTFTINSLQPKGCVVVRVAKVPSPPSSYGLTRIESYGYNNCNTGAARKVERGITITY